MHQLSWCIDHSIQKIISKMYGHVITQISQMDRLLHFLRYGWVSRVCEARVWSSAKTLLIYSPGDCIKVRILTLSSSLWTRSSPVSSSFPYDQGRTVVQVKASLMSIEPIIIGGIKLILLLLGNCDGLQRCYLIIIIIIIADNSNYVCKNRLLLCHLGHHYIHFWLTGTFGGLKSKLYVLPLPGWIQRFCKQK